MKATTLAALVSAVAEARGVGEVELGVAVGIVGRARGFSPSLEEQPATVALRTTASATPRADDPGMTARIRAMRRAF